MKIIINESQLRLIVENENKSHFNFTKYVDADPSEWDDMYEHINKKKGDKYDGYYIDGNINLDGSNVTELNHLVMVDGNFDGGGSFLESLSKLRVVSGNLELNNSNINNLDSLVKVGGYLNLSNTPIKDLPNLYWVETTLDVSDTNVIDIPNLDYVGKMFFTENSPIDKLYNDEEFRKYKIHLWKKMLIAKYVYK